MKRKYYCLLWLQFFFVTCIASQSLFAQTFNYKTYSIADGMPGSTCQNLFADSYGYLWVSMYADLLRFDGSSFTKFGADDGLIATYSSILFEDSNRQLWGGTFKNGVLSILQYTQGKFSTTHFEEKDSVGYLSSIFETDKKEIWACTERGLFKKSEEHMLRVNIGIDPSTQVRGIVQLNDHSLLICVPRFLFKKQPGGKIDTIAEAYSSGCKGFTGIRKAGDKIFVVGYDRIFYYSAQGLVPFGDKFTKHQYISCITTDQLGRFYAAGIDSGLMIFDHGKEIIIGSESMLIPGFISSMCEDREGNIWIGDLGLTRLRSSFIDHFTQKDGIQFNDTRSVFSDHFGNLFFGGAGNGFSVWDQSKFIPSSQLLAQNQLKKLEDHILLFWQEDDENNIWMMLHPNKILRYKNHDLEDVSAQFNPTGKRIGQFAFDPLDSSMYIAGDSLRVVKEDRIVVAIPIVIEKKADQPYVLCFDHAHRLWIGTTGKRLGYLDLSKPISATAPNQLHFMKSDLPGAPIYPIVCAPDGSIWAGTSGNGVFHIAVDGKGSIIRPGRLTEKDGLQSNLIGDLSFDHSGWLWVVTADGVSRFNLKSTDHGDEVVKSQSFGIDDGIKPESYVDAHIKVDQNNDVWISSYSGAYRIRSKNIFMDSLPPQMQIEKVNILNDSSGGENFTNAFTNYFHLPVDPVLPYNRNTLTIFFNAIAFAGRGELQCEYKLEGLQREWVSSEPKSNASFANLPAGNYIFHVRGRRKNYAWSEEATYSFIVLAPFWQTWWFYVLCVAAIFCLLYLAYRMRINRLLAVERTRTRIARDLHDDIGSTLTSISYFSTAAKMQLQNKEDNGSGEMLDKIGESSRSMINSMNDIVWAINPKNDQLEDLIARMKYYASEILGQRDIMFYFSIKGNIKGARLKMELRKNYFLIFKEAIHNIVKYANCKTVNIFIEHDHQNLVLTIRDDGAGFEKGEVSGEGNGMQNMLERSNEIAGQLVIESIKGSGTTIKLISKIT